MKVFLKNILTFSLLLIIIFLCLHVSLDWYLKKKTCNPTWANIFGGNIDVDIAVIGNSRAEVHYNPEIISKITGLKCYNLGLSGTPINTYNIRWNAYVNNNRLPSTLIIDVDYNFLGNAKGLFEKQQYLPYVNTKEYEEVVKELDEDFYKDLYVPMYKYKGRYNVLLSNVKSVLFSNCNDKFINGFTVYKNKWKEGEWNNFVKFRMSERANSKTFNSLYSNGIKHLETILEFCKKNKIRVVLVWSPQYYEVQKFKKNQRDYVDSVLRTIAKTNKLEYLNYSNDSLVFSKANFYNHSHLNYQGSEFFSKSIGLFLKNELLVD